MNGWRLCGVVALLLIGMSLFLLISQGSNVDGLRSVIRATARTSLVLFLLAFTASALVRLWPSGITRWQRRNRRYLGVSFAISHFIHLGAIVALARVDQELFWQLTTTANVVLAGAAYLFIAAMTATSFDRTAAWLGPRKWRLLHLVGGWYILVSFAVAAGKRLPVGPVYWAMFGLVVLAAILRVVAMQRQDRPVPVASS
jgi:methionine sulfoxide reductase heme-binding subunit